jgi:hypothetical protein
VRQAKGDLYSGGFGYDEFASRLEKLDRYERRALSRRKFAMRELDAASPVADQAWLSGLGKTKPIVVGQ